MNIIKRYGIPILLILIGALLMLAGCYNQFGEETQHYFIKKGDHHAMLANQAMLMKHTISANPPNPMAFNAVFGDGCDYHLDGGNKVHANKLTGFSLGFKHRKWSGRIGWIYNEQEYLMDIYGYSWINGQRDIIYITSILTHEYIDYIVEADSEGFTYTANNITVRVDGDLSSVIHKTRYRLYPYFGGDARAPQDMRLFINEF